MSGESRSLPHLTSPAEISLPPLVSLLSSETFNHLATNWGLGTLSYFLLPKLLFYLNLSYTVYQNMQETLL